eukprot:gene576-321_t
MSRYLSILGNELKKPISFSRQSICVTSVIGKWEIPACQLKNTRAFFYNHTFKMFFAECTKDNLSSLREPHAAAAIAQLGERQTEDLKCSVCLGSKDGSPFRSAAKRGMSDSPMCQITRVSD